MCTAAGIEVAALSTTELLLMYEGCLLKRTADSLSSFEALHTPPGRKFRHAAYNIDMCRGEAESPKTRFTWPAWRSNYFPGINLYYYIVPGGELCGVALGVHGGKGVNMW